MANKVRFGLSNLYVCTYTVGDGGAVTMGTPYHQAGAVNLSLDAESDSNDFFADNTKYWSGFSDNGYTGTLETALFDDDFKKQFLGYAETATGGLAQIKGATKPNVALMFQFEGDEAARRVILYNVALGAITEEYATTEDTTEPQTESLDFTATGDNATGIVKATYDSTSASYATLFTAPPAPALKTSGE